jgi:hypothetical protein
MNPRDIRKISSTNEDVLVLRIVKIGYYGENFMIETNAPNEVVSKCIEYLKVINKFTRNYLETVLDASGYESELLEVEDYIEVDDL